MEDIILFSQPVHAVLVLGIVHHVGICAIGQTCKVNDRWLIWKSVFCGGRA